MICFEKYLKYDNGRLIRKSNGDTAGWVCDRGYINLEICGKRFKAHRVVFYMHYGYMPDYIDHINGVRHDNRIENLREATLSQNGMNKKVSPRNSLGLKGVSFHKRTKSTLLGLV